MMRRIALALVAALLSLPAAAADEPLTPARVIGAGPNSGDVLLGALKLGRRQAGKLTLTPDALQAAGDISGGRLFGDGSGVGSASRGSTLLRTLFDRASDYVNVLNFPPGITFGKSATAAQITANVTTIRAAIVAAKNDGKAGIWFPSGDIVVSEDASGPPLIASNIPTGFIFRGDGTRFWLGDFVTGGTQRLVLFNQCKIVCGFAGNVTVDALNPVYDQGIITAVGSGYFDVALDWVPKFSAVADIWTIEENTPKAYLAKAGSGGIGPGLPLTDTGATAANGARIYRVNTSGTPVPILPGTYSTPAVGMEVVLRHTGFGGAVIHAVESDLIDVPEGFTVNGSHGAGLYAGEAAIQWRGRIEAPVISTPRGPMRRRLATSADGLHITSGGRGTTIAGTVCDTGDDLVNIYGYNGPATARLSATQITAPITGAVYGFPKLGEVVDFIDANRAFGGPPRRVIARSDSNGTATLTFDGSVPDGLSNTWEIANRTLNENYEILNGFHGCRSRAAGIRDGAARSKIGDIFLSEIMGPAITSTTYGDYEYTPGDLKTIGNIKAQRVNYGAGDEPLAAILIAPSLRNGQPVGKGAAGRVRISSLDVTDTNGRVLAVRGASQVAIGALRGTNTNLSPTTFDGVTNVFASFGDANRVEIGSASLFGTSPLPIALRNVDAFRMRNPVGVIAPASGATTIDADTGGGIAYTPALSALNGQAITAATASATYSISAKVCTIFYSATVTTAGPAAGSYLALSTPPGPCSTAASVGNGTGRENAQLGIAVVAVINPGPSAFAIYGGGNQATINNGYQITGSINFPLQ